MANFNSIRRRRTSWRPGKRRRTWASASGRVACFWGDGASLRSVSAYLIWISTSSGTTDRCSLYNLAAFWKLPSSAACRPRVPPTGPVCRSEIVAQKNRAAAIAPAPGSRSPTASESLTSWRPGPQGGASHQTVLPIVGHQQAVMTPFIDYFQLTILLEELQLPQNPRPFHSGFLLLHNPCRDCPLESPTDPGQPGGFGRRAR